MLCFSDSAYLIERGVIDISCVYKAPQSVINKRTATGNPVDWSELKNKNKFSKIFKDSQIGASRKGDP